MTPEIAGQIRAEVLSLRARADTLERCLEALGFGPAATSGTDVTAVTPVTPVPAKEERTDGRTDGRSKKEASPARGGKDAHDGAWLRRERIAADMSQIALSEIVGVSSSYLSRIEKGHDQMPARLIPLLEEALEEAKGRKQ